MVPTFPRGLDALPSREADRPGAIRAGRLGGGPQRNVPAGFHSPRTVYAVIDPLDMDSKAIAFRLQANPNRRTVCWSDSPPQPARCRRSSRRSAAAQRVDAAGVRPADQLGDAVRVGRRALVAADPLVEDRREAAAEQ